MQYACVLRLGYLSRLLPTRHHRLHRFVVPHAAFRTSHGLSKDVMVNLEEDNEGKDQRRTSPGITETRIRDGGSPSLLRNTRGSLGPHHRQASGLPSQDLSNGRSVIPRAFPSRMEIPSTFTPQDRRVHFVKEFDKLEDESQQLAAILRRFSQTEKHQRDRLAIIAAGKSRKNTLLRFIAWKNVLKDFNPESPPPMPASTEEAELVKWIQVCTNLDDMKERWPKSQQNVRKFSKDGSLALISAAVRCVPDKVGMVFEAALASPYGQPYWYIAEDVMELLASRLRAIGPGHRPPAAQKLAQMAIKILATRNEGSVHFSQFTIRSILVDLPTDAVESWYSQLLNAGCALHPFTEVRFAARLAKSSPTKALSAQMLVRLREANLLDINAPKAARIVTTILSFSKEDLANLDRNSATPADLFRDLHGAGLIPNVITYTTIIRGLCLRGDLSTALDVFEVMQQHGVQPNEWTYAILLHGCRMRNDWTALADIAVQACHANIRGNVVWNEVLHAIYTCSLRQLVEGRPRRALLYSMNSFYSRIFDATPVKPFITGRLAEMGEHVGQQQWFPEPLRRINAEIPSLSPQELRSPGSNTLSILLLSIIRSLPMPYDVVVFYSQYRQMLRQGHPIAKLMVQEKGSFVHDIVLRNLIKWPRTLRVALDILRDMMRDVVRDPETTGTKAPSKDGADFLQKPGEDRIPEIQSSSEPRRPPVPHPAPSIYTWTILVHGFMKAKQPQDAEYIITLMRNNGIKPNRVTWNTLVAGYAKMQMIPEAVNAMRRLEAEGHEADDWTMRAFSYIGNKAKAIELMEATVEANKAHKVAADLQHEQQGRILSLDDGAADTENASGQEAQFGPLPEGASEQLEEDYLDRELEAGLGLHLDTSLDGDVNMDADVDTGSNDRDGVHPPDISKRMAQVAGSRSGKIRKLVRNLEEVGPVQGSRYDIDGWKQVQEQGLDALFNAASRSSEEPSGGRQSKLSKKPRE